MANNLPTTYIQKLQVGAKGDFEDTFIFKVSGDDGGFGFPIMTEIQRDIVWPPASFPNPDWKGATIYNETQDRIQFNTGTTWFTFEAGSAPSNIAAFYQQYADDATYVVNNGPAVNGSVYYNTTLNAVRVYSNGAWYNDLVPEPWTNNTSYNVGQIVWSPDEQIFRCTVAHTSNAAGTIYDDIANWVRMGAHAVGDLDDVDTTGVADGDVLEWNTDEFVVSKKGTLETALTVKELAADPVAPAAGYVNIYAKTDKRIYLQDSDNKVTLLEVPLDVLHHGIIDASTLDSGGWVELVASTSATIRRGQFFDQAGLNLEIGIGVAASEVTKFVTGKGTNESIDVEIPAGSRIAVRNEGGAGGTFGGQVAFNFLG